MKQQNHSVRRSFIRWLWFFIGTLAGCGESTPEYPDLAYLSELGPHQVGARSFTVTYVPPLSTEDRTLQVLAWYPAKTTEGFEPFLYLFDKSTVAHRDAPPAELQGVPVALFSHGHQAYASAMYNLMEHLASHGWVVVAPYHTGNTLGDGGKRSTEIYYQRPLDIQAVARALSQQPELGSLASSSYSVIGHSFGAYTAFAAGGVAYATQRWEQNCLADPSRDDFCSTLDSAKLDIFRQGFFSPKIQAIVSIEPGNFDLFREDGFQELAVPILQITADIESADDPFWLAIQDLTAVEHLNLKDGAHNDFIDACAVGVGLRCSNLPVDLVQRELNGQVLSFLRRRLSHLDEPPFEKNLFR